MQLLPVAFAIAACISVTVSKPVPTFGENSAPHARPYTAIAPNEEKYGKNFPQLLEEYKNKCKPAFKKCFFDARYSARIKKPNGEIGTNPLIAKKLKEQCDAELKKCVEDLQKAGKEQIARTAAEKEAEKAQGGTETGTAGTAGTSRTVAGGTG